MDYAKNRNSIGDGSQLRRLLLFDIDGTLICTSGVGRQVMAAALKQVYGTAGSINDYPFAGKTDLRIIRDILSDAGVSEDRIVAGLQAVYDQMASLGEVMFFDDGLEQCPGISQLLEILNKREDTLLGLQTGNIRPTASLKLQAAGINPAMFTVGAFGSDAISRYDLLPIAWQRAATLTRKSFSGRNTIVIGDTPADIETARNNKSSSVAVATGTLPATSLAKHDPDFLLSDLAQTDLVLNILLA